MRGAVIKLAGSEADAAGREPAAFTRILAGAIEGGALLLRETSAEVEESANQLSFLFRGLTDASGKQTDRLIEMSRDVSVVEVDGVQVSLMDLPRILQQSLAESIQQVLMLSKQGVTLVYSLDDILGQIKELEAWTSEIEAINKQTRLLSLNARIESERAQSAEFKVVSVEMSSLSQQIDSLAGRMRASISSVRRNVTSVIQQIKDEYQKMSQIGAMDLTSQVSASNYLEQLLDALLARNEVIQKTLDHSAGASREMTETINGIVMSMQFQDRLKQRSDAICAALEAISTFVRDTPEGMLDDEASQRLGESIVERTPLSEVKRVLASTILGIEPPPVAATPDAPNGGDIELF